MNQEIKNIEKDLEIISKLIYLGNDLKEYKDRLKKLEKINFKKYKNYTTLKNLISRSEKSKKGRQILLAMKVL